jgi:hypothetical protein
MVEDGEAGWPEGPGASAAIWAAAPVPVKNQHKIELQNDGSGRALPKRVQSTSAVIASAPAQ